MATTIAIIGTGAVGTTVAFACLMRNLCAHILLVDVDQTRCQGEAMDLADALSFSESSSVSQVTLEQAACADIIIITAGKPQKEGQARTELLDCNKAIIKSIFGRLKPNPNAICIMVTNPVDALTDYAQTLCDLPKEQIFGSGTMLETARLRNLISQRVHIAQESIHVYIIGEHGESGFAVFSQGHIGGKPLTDFLDLQQLENMSEQAKHKVYEIITCKGFTNYGVAACVAATCENILFDQNRIAPISCYIPEYDLCMSVPAAVGARGISGILMPKLNDEEIQKMAISVEKLRQMQRV